ncbi:MAG: hypothetical protein PHQ90_04030 [Sulfuricurvum sp.]|uniref:hypothetical protein n=1 Tax=Sulfuricurvum sp. TaxID=2025608 RepID=UPI00260844AA|nr:hypothetical protein [Sulfuricurvum sp.]MDD2368447.1 hypothetical protein [Sulfuricurvum sp.]MDD5119027.1 hypothetical protein [Sulfuricurvum sp.]
MATTTHKSIFSDIKDRSPKGESIFNSANLSDNTSSERKSLFNNEHKQALEPSSIFSEKIERTIPKTKKIFQLESFIPEISDSIEFNPSEKKILNDLKFGPDDIEKFLSFDKEVIELFQKELSSLVNILYRDEFSKSRQLLSRLLEIVEENEEERKFFFFKSKRNTQELSEEIKSIIKSLKDYENRITDSRTELNNYLATFDSIKHNLTRYKKIALYLLEYGHYDVFDNPQQIKAILIHKISNIEERLLQIDTGSEIHTLKTYLIDFSLIIENVILQNYSYLISLAHESTEHHLDRKNIIIQKLKGFLNG